MKDEENPQELPNATEQMCGGIKAGIETLSRGMKREKTLHAKKPWKIIVVGQVKFSLLKGNRRVSPRGKMMREDKTRHQIKILTTYY